MRWDLFEDRVDAGQQLAQQLQQFKHSPDTIVLALPRGGVPVGAEVARQLALPMDIFLVRKLGVPDYPELAMGAIAEGGVSYLDQELIRELRIPDADISKILDLENRELIRRQNLYRRQLPALYVENKTVLVIDDGLATGSSMIAAIRALQTLNPKRIVVGVPVAARDSLLKVAPLVDELVAVLTPEFFRSVGQWYRRFEQISDEEVYSLLHNRSGNCSFAVS